MKPIPDCIPDALRLVLESARLVSDDGFIHRKVLGKVMAELAEDPDFGSSSVALTFRCLDAAYKALGVKDPYAKEKARRNKAMLGLEKSFRAYLDVAPDRLQACLNLVLAGSINKNILGRAEVERQILEQLDTPLARDDRQALIKELARAEKVLYVVDAAGEILLDKLLMEELRKKCAVTAVVAHRPILDAATRADAESVGLDDIAEIVDPAAPMLGLILERASSALREVFDAADVVLVKGETNLEALGNANRPLFFLLQAECETVAARLSVVPGSVVLMHYPGRPGSGVLEAVGSRQKADAKTKSGSKGSR